MFKTPKSFESPRKGTLPEPIGILKLKGEEDWRDFFKVYVGKVCTKVSDNEYQFVDGEYYQIASDEYVCSTDCSVVWYQVSNYIPK